MAIMGSIDFVQGRLQGVVYHKANLQRQLYYEHPCYGSRAAGRLQVFGTISTSLVPNYIGNTGTRPCARCQRLTLSFRERTAPSTSCNCMGGGICDTSRNKLREVILNVATNNFVKVDVIGLWPSIQLFPMIPI